jgi:citrate lyase synthetase
MDKKLLHYICVPKNLVENHDNWEDFTYYDTLIFDQFCFANVEDLDKKDFDDIFNLIFQNFYSKDKIWKAIRHAEKIIYIRTNLEESLPIVACALLCGETIRSVEYVCVDEKYRGNDLATYMIRNLIDFVYYNLPDTPHLTLVSKPELRQLYEGCGFKVVAES